MGEREELERAAREAGLQALLPEHVAILEKSFASARKLKSEMSRDFALSDEPAHVFRADRV